MLLTVATENPAHVGDQILTVRLTLEDYKSATSSAFLTATITVQPCMPLELLPPEDAKPLSPLWLVFTLPDAFTIELPLFEPSPVCGLTNADLVYKVIGDDLPAWATFATDERVVKIDVQDDPLLGGTSVPITIEASYGTIAQEMSFAISFIKEDEEPAAPKPTVVESEPEPETADEEPIEEVVEDEKPAGWDGWKSLLLLQLMPGLDI